MLLTFHQAVPHHSIKHDRYARFADQQKLDQCPLLEFALVPSQKIENVELGRRNSELSKKALATTLQDSLHQEQGRQQIMGGRKFDPSMIGAKRYDIKLIFRLRCSPPLRGPWAHP